MLSRRLPVWRDDSVGRASLPARIVAHPMDGPPIDFNPNHTVWCSANLTWLAGRDARPTGQNRGRTRTPTTTFRLRGTNSGSPTPTAPIIHISGVSQTNLVSTSGERAVTSPGFIEDRLQQVQIAESRIHLVVRLGIVAMARVRVKKRRQPQGVHLPAMSWNRLCHH